MRFSQAARTRNLADVILFRIRQSGLRSFAVSCESWDFSDVLTFVASYATHYLSPEELPLAQELLEYFEPIAV